MKKLHIIEIETGEVVRSIEVSSPWKYEKVLRGLLRQMNTERFYVDTSEFDEVSA